MSRIRDILSTSFISFRAGLKPAVEKKLLSLQQPLEAQCTAWN
jgi:hypothetical protein